MNLFEIRAFMDGHEIGEIVSSGDNVTLGYWNDPDETAKYFSDNRLYTGDLATVDQDGYIFITNRARDFIKSMGNRVNSKEVEEIISEMPEVVETAVIGVPHGIQGEAIRAFVVLHTAGILSPQNVKDHCLERLPMYKVPQQVEFLDRLPKTESGKVAKTELR